MRAITRLAIVLAIAILYLPLSVIALIFYPFLGEEGIAGGYFTVFNLCKTLKRWCFENIKRIEKDEKTKING
ncbi:hypothetical protein [Streptococcus equi]|uniref:hypothetical protein n=1 Tax=Streptococcus equi TaxID=1336 RepID=UPI001BDE7A74|nr:hypothetical protein [Streptococcus equi]MBT1218970.1 hypothetical protein [Streptococcus equi subsp. equi]MCD3523437.1 hypothetical protein [Streptococcus equi subsp. equi]